MGFIQKLATRSKRVKENKKPIKEFALASLALAFLMKKFIIPWLKKNPELKDDLKNEIDKVNVKEL